MCSQVEASPKDSLMTLLELSPNSINNTKRLRLLRRAFQVQSKRIINASFVEVTGH